MKNLAIIGSGDLGRQIAYHAINDKHYNVVGFFDDFAEKGSLIDGIKILGNLSEIQENFDDAVFDEIIIGIGYKHLQFRETLFIQLQNKVEFAKIIHSSCYVDPSCKIGEGVCMFPGTVLDQNVTIEDNVLINIDCTIAHDSKIKTNTFLSPRVAIAGFVTIGKRCNIGINSTIIDNIVIENDIQTGGGTVVINDLKKSGLYVGNPSRFVR